MPTRSEDPALQAHFNALPRVRRADSQRFKAAAKAVIATEMPRWKAHAIRTVAEDEAAAASEADPADLPPAERWLARTDYRRSESKYAYQLGRGAHRLLADKSPEEQEAVVDALATRLRVYTNADLSDQLKKAAAWVDANVGGARWVALTEKLVYGRGFKSAEWTLGIAWKHLATKPWCVTSLARPGGPAEPLAGFYARDGVRHYVMFDDAAYSGSQKSTQIVSTALRFLSDAAAAAGPGAEPVTVYFAVPFCTDAALRKFAQSAIASDGRPVPAGAPGAMADADVYAFPGGHRVVVWTGGVRMPSLADVLAKMPELDAHAAAHLHESLFENAGSLCIFEHKIPDGLSLPWMFGAVFQRTMTDHYVRMPPYNPAVPPSRPASASPPSGSPEPERTFECFSGGAPRRRAPRAAPSRAARKSRVI